MRALGLCGVASLAILLRVPFLSVPLTVDEGGYGLWAWLWTSDFQIYRDFMFARPQAIILVYELIQWASDGSTEAIRVCAAFYNALTVVAVFALSRRLFGERAAWLSAVLFAVFSAAPRVEGFTANAELFTFLPLVLNALLVWERRWFWAGLATSIAFQLKPSGVEGCILIAICVITGASSLREAISGATRSLAGFFVGMVPMFVHAYLVGWDAFVYNLVTLRGMSYSREFFSLEAQGTLLPAALAFTVSAWAVPALLFSMVVPGLDSRKRTFFVAWLVGALVAMAIGLYWSWHFFLQLIPPLSVAGGAAWEAWRKKRSRWVWVVALGVAGAAFAVREAPFFTMDPKAICWNLYHRPSYLAVDDAADYVARTTRPEALVYVAFGEPELYYLARRRPAVLTQLFNGHARWLDFSWNDAVAAVSNRTPEVIVWAQPPPAHRMSAQEFAQLLAPGYRPEAKVGVIRILRRMDGETPAPP